jgi:8-oxo-dGTP diphosphatase
VNKMIHVAGAVIQNAQGEILCALRSAGMSMPGLWEFPGGKLETGESPQSCLVREIKEELGCEIEVGGMIADVEHDYPSIRVHLMTYFAAIVSGVPEAREHERLEWLPASRLRELEWAPADLSTVDKLLS